MTLEDKRTDHLYVKDTTLHIYTELTLNIDFHSIMGFYFRSQMWVVSVIDPVIDKLSFVTGHNASVLDPLVQDAEHAVLWYQHMLSCCNILHALVHGS
jgi:hypothetical protein